MNIDEKIFKACLWFLALCVFLAIVTSCNPYQGLQRATPTATAIAEPTITASVFQVGRLIPTPIPSPTCTVNAGTLYLRKGAGMNYAVTKILHDGDILTVLERGDWLKVETSQHVKGWVYSKYCK